MDESQATAQPAPELKSLGPEFNGEQHQVYLDILVRAIDEQAGVRNIALAGAYGTGKSSILRKLADSFKGRVVEISLMTLGKKLDPIATGAEGNPAAGTPTNRVQKEIVKQLLYRRSPSQAPESRFNRIARFRSGREIGIAVLAGILTLAVLVAAGLDTSPLARLGIALPVAPPWVSSVMSYVAIIAATSLIVLAIRLLLRGRLGLEKVTAGPATITLPPRSTSYFDEYLDEIIYFFETNRKLDIVIIEDLDRFDDPHIFESLRSLNLVLNTARQLDNRNIRFIYAVKDSIFENLGRDSDIPKNREAEAELVRANRTKFFELVVPVVPFITHKNARDLMHDHLTSRGHALSKELISLAARHVADMRLIQNIINEYEVFKHRLLDAPTTVPDLTPERLFAMVLFKNAHAHDFEAIRLGNSSLDRLYETWRALVDANIQHLLAEDQRLIGRIEQKEASAEHAIRLGGRLRAVISTLASAPGSALLGEHVYVDGIVIEDEEITSTAFWEDVAGGTRSITVRVLSREYPHRTPMTLSATALESLIGSDLSPLAHIENSETEDRAQIDQNRAGAEFLRRHDWKALTLRTEFKYFPTSHDDPNDAKLSAAATVEKSKNFQWWIGHLLPSRLAAELVTDGWITPYFSLYVSAFYGQLIRPDAMNYVVHNIDKGVTDPHYELDSDDVAAILRDQGNSVLRETTMYNVSILDHLLLKDTHRTDVVIANLRSWGPEELAFLDIYFASGAATHELVAELVPYVRNLFVYLVERAPVERQEKARLIDVASVHRKEYKTYHLSPLLSQFVEDNYLEMPSLTSDENGSAARTVQFIARLKIELDDVSKLSDAACEALSDTRAYRLTRSNLVRLTGTENIALDVIKQASERVYRTAIAKPDEYVQAHSESASTPYTIEDPGLTVEILKETGSWDESTHGWLVEGAHPDGRIPSLTEVPPGAWPALVRSLRAPATFDNVAAYVDQRGAVDLPLATLLGSVDQIRDLPDDQSARADLAVDILRGTVVELGHRVSLALALEPGKIATTSIEPEPGEFVGRLLEAGLIEDDEDAFDSRLMVDWATQEYAIGKSQEYGLFVGPETLPVAHIAPLMRSATMEREIQADVAARLDEFASVPVDAFEAVAAAALDRRIVLDAPGIETVLVGGARRTSVVALLAMADDALPIEDLRSILRRLGDPYSVIADPGPQWRQLADNPTHRALLERLQGAGVVSSFKSKGGSIRVNLRKA
ncbi:YobI family P-loop NTPase [Oerskovia paurometabola]|uniref:YobI-like P-loop NTPase domain-containing protein n=1 Tax=Oerskovia paurometabola TaxID=162170 RepID=A0ABW1XBU7_9CELL|nr:hypothetical protein [Oerskovia paurometabola]MBM7498872.1 hypothetical protein [Oerskovia paurometabola]